MSHVVEASAAEAATPVAARVLGSRLERVSALLPLAADHADEDVEYVHELRVATRRAVAAVEVFRDVVPAGPRRRLLKTLRKIRRAAGQARDCDVLLARWRVDAAANRPVLRRLQRRRREAQRRLESTHARLQRTNRLARRIARVVESLSGSTGRPFGEWALAALEQWVEAFFRAAQNPAHDERALHRFRIRTKQLRYVLEIVGGALPAVSNAIPAMEALQEKLGEITDELVARARLRKQLERRDARKTREIARLLKEEEGRLSRDAAAFYSWWTPDRSEDLHLKLLEPFSDCRSR